jgi:internalin A
MRVLGKFKKLRMLDLYGAPITDAGVAHLKDLVEMENLQLGETLLGDEALRTIGTFTKLTDLDARSPNVTDAGLMHLKNLKLHWLALGSDKVTGPGLAALRDMTDVDCLWLDGTRIDDASLDHLAGLKKLQHFGICKTRVTDAGLAKLTGLEQIESLKLDDLPLTDASIPTLTAMHSLKDVQMNWTQVTDAGFKQLQDAGIKRINIFRR